MDFGVIALRSSAASHESLEAGERRVFRESRGFYVAFCFEALKVGLVARLRSRIGFVFCSLAFLQILGGHWAILQMGAWAGMIVQYSQQTGLITGLSQTFDGEHPCPICKAIQNGKKQEEKKAPQLNTELKKDYLAVWNHFQVYRGWVEAQYPAFLEQLQGLAVEPAVPPPRS